MIFGRREKRPALLTFDRILVPIAGTEVLALTPGPVMWKLCAFDLSATTILIVPRLFGFDAIVIVKPGPTVPLYTGVAAMAGSATASAATSAAANANLFIPLLVRGFL